MPYFSAKSTDDILNILVIGKEKDAAGISRKIFDVLLNNVLQFFFVKENN